ncbi:MAG: glycerophosphodiester phosphodiesterase [Myxococcales bacterium]
MPVGRPLVLGHRGASADAPENTLAAFREAIRQGADGVELDVQLCATGEVVVAHDETLERVSGEKLSVRGTPFSRLREVDVGRHFSERFAGERVPTLAEVLEALPPNAVVDVELKCDALRDGGLTERALEVISRYPGRPIVVTSFNPVCLLRARMGAPSLPLGALWEEPRWTRAREIAARAAEIAVVAPHHPLCGKEMVARWHERGFAVASWTVDEPAEIERCVESGVDVIITNRPGLAQDVVKRLVRK